MNARDRIGRGPWYNAKATLIARDLDELHGMNMLTKQTALTEKGAAVNGRGDTPNMHDILTGSQPDGKAFPTGNDMTCKNWTSSTAGNAMVGHSDRAGTTNDPQGQSWNSSHPSRDCSQDGLEHTAAWGCSTVSRQISVTAFARSPNGGLIVTAGGPPPGADVRQRWRLQQRASSGR